LRDFKHSQSAEVIGIERLENRIVKVDARGTVNEYLNFGHQNASVSFRQTKAFFVEIAHNRFH
jgi:hypothetical protein